MGSSSNVPPQLKPGKLKFYISEFGKLFVLVSLSFLLGLAPPVKRASLAMWDAIVTWSSVRPAEGADNIRLVVITPEDYKAMFNSKSPLDVEGLAGFVGAAVCGGAKQVFVDISTEDVSFASLTDKVAERARTPGGQLCIAETSVASGSGSRERSLAAVRDKVVWARGYVPRTKEKPATELPVLGGNQVDGKDISAPVVLQADSDGRVRRLPQLTSRTPLWHLAADALDRPHHWSEEQRKDEENEELIPGFVPALRHNSLKKLSAPQLMSSPELVADKVVFLGGTYGSGDSFYMADGENHAGVEVLAAAALALKNNHLVHEFNEAEVFGFKLLLGIVIWLLNHAQVRPRTRLTWSLLILPLVCVLAVFLSMALSFILDLGALLFAILLEQSIEGSLRHSDGPPAVKGAEAVAGEK